MINLKDLNLQFTIIRMPYIMQGRLDN